MHIVLISTPIGFLGSGKGGGVELTLNSLVSGLLSLGHSVEVIAPKNSKLFKCNQKAKLYFIEGEDQISWQHQNYNSPVTIPDNSLLAGMLEKGIDIAKQADVILNMSYDWLPIWMTLNVEIPIAHIISMGSQSSVISNLISKVYAKYPYNFAFHSKIQANDYSFIKKPIIIGNGFKLENYNFLDSVNGPLAWVGRVAKEKGLEDAVYVANKLGEKLNVWGFIEDETYAKKIEQSFPKGTINWMGFLTTYELQKELGKCRVLLNTPKWNEAYGNVIVEALACGVPVVAYRRGGPSEIIQHGETGYLAHPDDKETLLSYVKIVKKIRRENCREWVEKNASTDIFANKVVNWLNKVIKEY
ncbi:glycosyl transferase [Prochlorococcus marinus str. MU1404]|uniref:glycosyltransferase family 4 protein n=1 Tax=Prochlorococcus marinus TaxID=1219 RepID=UPI001ADD2B87|nr:glycosyltransferase family 4 protein [Prochlorococcus marinus]MBO8230503.1 glycosyltransferase family 4 protein [Prochlorococcus marinus XMU1404]MBW3073549.1 glycosyl transferase [Prochlorococcus marinus str. MU1404]MCR8545163.1 glycosyltransferase family 4 protein [Prochlorococcus marinus CUG1432]